MERRVSRACESTSKLTAGSERKVRKGAERGFEAFCAVPSSPSVLLARETGNSTTEIPSMRLDSGGGEGRAARASAWEVDWGSRMVVGMRRCGVEVDEEGDEGAGMIFSERWKRVVDSSHVFTAFASWEGQSRYNLAIPSSVPVSSTCCFLSFTPCGGALVVSIAHLSVRPATLKPTGAAPQRLCFAEEGRESSRIIGVLWYKDDALLPCRVMAGYIY